jgi:hypothetical protein
MKVHIFVYMDFSFFITDNKSGHKTKESWFSKNHPKEYQSVIDYCGSKLPTDSSFKEKVWVYFNALDGRPCCESCGSTVKFSERFDRGYNQFCSLDCANKSGLLIDKIKKSNLENHGVEFYTQHKDFVGKQKKTKSVRYGNENYNNVGKMLSTKLDKYGNTNYNNFDLYKKTCLNKYGEDNFCKTKQYRDLLKNKIKERYPNLDIKNISEDLSELEILCDDCHTEYKISQSLLRERVKHKYVNCTNCNPVGMSFSSSYEDELSKILNEWGVAHLRHTKIPGTKLELDILIPQINLAIEFNGLFWHNELFVNTEYHLNKTELCDKNGMDLIHIFEDEWLYKKDVVLSIIKNKLGLITQRVYARNCRIKLVTSGQHKDFLEDNHIQGSVNTTIKLGLFYGDELVSLMTFGRRNGIGKTIDWELIRFCNKKDTIVVGSASKLFKYFIKNYEPKNVISYSDRRWFSGELYQLLGFKPTTPSQPNYWYVNNTIRYHRLNFKKNVLVKQGFDKNKSEREIMFERGYYRIYDCGNIRWEYFSE